VVVDTDMKKIEKLLEAFPKPVFLEGDATESSTLVEAGIGQAKGLFAVTTDDNQNLVISLTAKQANPNVRVVARCQDLRNVGKIKKAGADAVVSPTYIGGLRMASEMVRPAVATFLDTMLRDKEKRLRIEEITLAASFGGKTVSTVNLQEYRNTLLMAVKTKGDLVYNPSRDYLIQAGDILILMTTPEERDALEKELG
jgi:voltage-gated potassium channel